MKPIKLFVPKVSGHAGDLVWLFSVAEMVRSQRIAVSLDFSQCTQLHNIGVALLGGIARLARASGSSVSFDWQTCRRKVLGHFQETGFAEVFGGPIGPGGSHAIPYREDQVHRPGEIVEYLRARWLGMGWVNISDLLSDAIAGHVLEIYANAFEHGRSKVGVVSCGFHYANSKTLSLSVVDFGRGIPANVREYAQNLGIPARVALEWAFRNGTSTARGATARGVGLGLLRQFLTLNGGKMEVFSTDGQAKIEGGKARYFDSKSHFGGTLVTITVVCDDARYQFAHEDQSGQQQLF